MRRLILRASRLGSALLLAWGCTAAAQAEESFVPGEMLVKLRPGVSASDLESAGALVKGKFEGDPDLYLVSVASVEGATRSLNQREDVIIAEPNYIYYTTLDPNDPRYPDQYALRRIAAADAWDLSIGSAQVVIADTDSGINYNHPDLAANIWVNTGEICNNGIDDDQNGFIDDCIGWNFFDDNNDPVDGNGHGTHTGGIMAAVGNNGIGVAGVLWQAQVMPLKVGPGPGLSEAAAIRAIDYAWQNGARAINASWGGGSFSQMLRDAIERAGNAGVLFIAAAGNAGRDSDVAPFYPAGYDLANIIAVAATNSSDTRWPGSNYGRRTVHLGAPGASVLSTFLGGYATLTGTSMAAPHVTAAAALVWTVNPRLSATAVKDILLGSVDPLPALKMITITGGRLNLASALATTPSP